MSALMDPLDEQQLQVLNIVWPLFAEHHRFPVYNHVRAKLRKLGLDAGEVLNSFPSVEFNAHTRYSAFFADSSGSVIQDDSQVRLTMAGLFHVNDHFAMEIIGALLTYVRALSDARAQAAQDPFNVPRMSVSLAESLEGADLNKELLPWATAIADREWPGMRINNRQVFNNGVIIDVSAELGVLPEAYFYTIEDYLNAVATAITPQRPTAVPQYRDPRSLSRSITNFDITCELVLQAPLVKKPALDRTALFVQDAASYTDLQSGISALGELFGDLQVPGRNPSYATGRLLSHLVQALPNIDQARVQDALNLMDAVREIRNSGVHPKPSAKLIAAHEQLGLPFPLRDPAHAWDVIRAQMDVAFSILQEEIYAARP
jgi:hypothetical protein